MDNYTANEAGDGPGVFAAITVMKKGDGVWFWAQYNPDGSLAVTPDGTVIAGTQNLACADCHESEGRRDDVITDFRPGA